MSEDRERFYEPEDEKAAARKRDEEADVEAHRLGRERLGAADEEGEEPDVEAHRLGRERTSLGRDEDDEATGRDRLGRE